MPMELNERSKGRQVRLYIDELDHNSIVEGTVQDVEFAGDRIHRFILVNGLGKPLRKFCYYFKKICVFSRH